MDYFRSVKDSFRLAWHNLSLLAILVLEFVLMSLLGLLFFLLDTVVAFRMNPGAAAAGSPADFLRSFMNAETVATMIAIMLVQAVLMTFIDSFFKAGFFGMAKNTLQDGSTTFREFVPEAKKAWKSMFGFQLLRYAILAVFSVPLVVAGMQMAGTTPAQTLLFLLSLAVLGLAWLLVTFFLLYGEAAIVFEREGSLDALRRTARLVRDNMRFTVKLFLAMLLVIVAAAALKKILALPFEIIASSAESWIIAADLANLVFGLITMFASVVVALFVFRGYQEIAG